MTSEAATHTPRSTGRRLGVTVVVLAGFVALGFMLRSDKDSTEFVVAAGVCGSLIASFIALRVNLVVLPESPDGVRVELSRLASGAPLLDDGERHGIRTLKPKDTYVRDEWLDVLRRSRETLFVVGHALDKWCTADMRPDFRKAIRRLTSRGKPVVLIVLPPDGEITRRLGEQRGLDYRKRVRETLTFLADVRHDLPDRAKKKLDVRVMREHVSMPYMVAGNEHTLITAAYPIAAQNSGTMLALTVDAKTPFGRAIREDLRSLVAHHSEPA